MSSLSILRHFVQAVILHLAVPNVRFAMATIGDLSTAPRALRAAMARGRMVVWMIESVVDVEN